nr:retrotransposon protein, putative, Ty1-copia subclass [Tanacetum cinerariifolium]
SINDESFDKCESCISGKMTKKPLNNNIERATDLLGLIHTNVCAPLRHVSRKGASYFLTFTDDFSRYGYVYLLKHKNEVFEKFKVFKSEIELQLGKKIKALRSDRGGEYLSQEFKDYISKNGIVQHLTSAYTPQQNGVSDRRNHTLLDMVRSMFNLTTLPLSFWDYALESAVRILNMVPTKKVDKTPYEIWHGKAPKLSYLKVWGCEAYVKCDSADKLYQRSVKCIFVRYPKETMCYYFYFPPENKVIIARYGNFLERDLISQKFSGRDNDLEDDHMDILPSENTSEIPVESISLGSPPELIPFRREPANYKASMPDPDKLIWQGAMYEEINSMKVMKVWILVDLPPNAKVVRSKWLYKKKTDMDGFGRSCIHSKKGYLPIEVKHDLSNELCASTPEEVAYMKRVPYTSAVGSIMYAVRCTRPDVAFAQNLVSRYQQNPGKLHWVAVKYILKYLRNTRDMFLMYEGKPDTELIVTSFCDASWQCDKNDTKSQTGYVFVVDRGAVDWKSKKQTTISMHSAQAEYVAASEAAMEAVWIRKFVRDLGTFIAK